MSRGVKRGRECDKPRRWQWCGEYEAEPGCGGGGGGGGLGGGGLIILEINTGFIIFMFSVIGCDNRDCLHYHMKSLNVFNY